MTEPRNNRGASRQDYATPLEFIRAVEQRFGKLDFDLAASSENRKALQYFDAETDSLAQDWTTLRGNLWLNPPFANIEPWARKCAESARRLDGIDTAIFMLTPASIGSNWFLRHVFPFAEVLALNPRMSFDGVNVFPKDCMLSVFPALSGPAFDVWRWK